MIGKFDLTNVNNMAFYISGPKLLFETTEISTQPNSTQQESNYIYLYTTKFGTLIKIQLNQKFESTEFETMRVNCIYISVLHSNLIQRSKLRDTCYIYTFFWDTQADLRFLFVLLLQSVLNLCAPIAFHFIVLQEDL